MTDAQSGVAGASGAVVGEGSFVDVLIGFVIVAGEDEGAGTVVGAGEAVLGEVVPESDRYQFSGASPRHSPTVTPFHPFCLIKSK